PTTWAGWPGSSTRRIRPSRAGAVNVRSNLHHSVVTADGPVRTGRAHQGHGASPGRAYEPADRLRSGGRVERHRRSNDSSAVYRAVADEHAGPARHHGAGKRFTAAAQE